MGRYANPATTTAENGDHNIVLVATVVIGVLLMFTLIMCYACVLRRLCCGTPRERRERKASANRTESIPMGDVILLSQLTESDKSLELN